MSGYEIALWSLISALFTQALAAGLAMEVYLRPDLPRLPGRSWLAITIASLLLALHHGYSFELAIRTGLFDMRQAILAALVGLFFALGVFGFRRQQA